MIRHDCHDDVDKIWNLRSEDVYKSYKIFPATIYFVRDYQGTWTINWYYIDRYLVIIILVKFETNLEVYNRLTKHLMIYS